LKEGEGKVKKEGSKRGRKGRRGTHQLCFARNKKKRKQRGGHAENRKKGLPATDSPGDPDLLFDHCQIKGSTVSNFSSIFFRREGKKKTDGAKKGRSNGGEAFYSPWRGENHVGGKRAVPPSQKGGEPWE